MSALPPIAGDGRRRRIALVAVLALGQAVAAGVAAFATRDVFASLGVADATLPLKALALVAAAGILLGVLRIGERVMAERLGQDYAAALRLKLFTHVTRMSVGEVARRRLGMLTIRFVGDLAAVRGWVSLGLARLISAGIVLPAATVVLYLLDARLAGAAAIPLLVGLAVMTLAGLALGPAHRRLRSRRARLAADVSERLPRAPELHLLGRTALESTRLVRLTERMIDAAVQRARGAAVIRAVPDAVAGLAGAAVMLTAFRSGLAPAETAGALAALGLMVRPLRDLAGVADRWRAWVVARDKCLGLLAAPTLRRRQALGAAAVGEKAPFVRFVDVSAGRLEGLSIDAASGAKVAIVGPNGAGKSTLINLAAGLEQPHEGTVLLGERAPLSLTAAERRRTIALVAARSPILAGSVRRALTLGMAPRPTDDDILAAAARFGLAPVLDRLGGLDGTVSEGAQNLSAGQVRRLLLARAALSQARLLLLDEPDDALDADAPRLVADLVRGTDATVLLTTHNPAVAAAMDELWYIEAGRLLEHGPPDKLLAGEGPAARFFHPRSAA